MTQTLVLATGSKYKRSLFERLGLPFVCQSADVDESAKPGERALELAQRLALSKARALAKPGIWVLGADQVIALGEHVFNKPGTSDLAVEQLMRLSGQTHELITAMAVVGPEAEAVEVVRFEMQMRAFSEVEAREYVDLEMPVDCAGSYKIEGAGIRLFEAMRGDDFTAIIGLALTRVRPLLLATRYIEELA